ncbi:MAG: hypothetical protein JTJ17_11230 [Streptococcus gordonii]|nr:hypothetical protein [Streptococcus gordonii]
MIKLLRLMIMGLLASLFLSACQNTLQPQKVDQLEIGTVYHDGGEFKLLDGNHFVMIQNQASFDSEKKLEQYRIDNDDDSFYPNIYFAEGTYEKSGDEYRLKVLRSVEVEFKNVSNIEKKIISTNRVDNIPAKNGFRLVKKESYYAVNGKVPLKTSDQKIPDSIDEFLSQYQYEPEELE